MSAGAPSQAVRRVEHVMGTAVTIDVREGRLTPADLGAVFAQLRDVDARFSPYRPDSEISRLGRGEMDEAACSPEVRHVLALCDDLRRTSGGYFDARGYRPDGRPDPTAVVKGWAVEEAAWLLVEAGARRFAINAGGDVVVRGGIDAGQLWRVGIRYPRRADWVATVLRLRDGAVATSGAYERGAHILDPHTGRAPDGLVSLTVVGPSLTYADAYATAAYAMGPDGLAWVEAHSGFAAYAITPGDRVLWTAGLDAYLAA
ncbi:MAG: FAD:protein FMN transferase [Candidatus Limnocylindrales bacterium]